MSVQIQFRRDTAANWTANNPTLAEGELGLVTDTGQYKVGNGVDNWNTLTFSELNGVFDSLPLNATTDPAAPASGLILYAKSVSGRVVPKIIGPAGIDTPLQNAVWQNGIVEFRPGAAAGVWENTVGSNLGTAAIALPTTTNLATMLRRSTFANVVTTLNQQVGTRSEAMFYRGNAANLGGFFFACRFMLGTWTAGDRLFIGFSTATTGMVTVQPSTLTNTLGFCIEAGDTAITFLHNDGAGTGVKETISGQPALATNNGYAAYIFCKPNDSTVYWRLDNINTQTTINQGSVTTDLPVNTTALVVHAAMSNGANTAAGAATLGVSRIYIETDV